MKRMHEVNDLIVVAFKRTGMEKHAAISQIPKINICTICQSLNYQKSRNKKVWFSYTKDF